MKKMILTLSVLLVGIPFAAAAQDNAPDVTRYRFDDELVRGDLVRPDGEILSVRAKRRSKSLVRAREHFVPEMLKSVENM